MGGLETAPRAQLLDVGLGVHLGEPFGHVSGEGGQHRRHVELALAGDDLLLQCLLSLQPRHRQRTAEAVEVGHAVPRQVRRTGEVAADLLVRHPELLPHFVPDGLLSGDGERHVDAVQRHPVDEPLPLRPFPPRHRVAVGAVVQEEAVLDAGRRLHRLRNGRKLLGQGERVTQQPAVLHMAVVLEIVVQAHGHRIRVIADDGELSAALFQPEEVALPFRLLEDEMASLLRPHPAGRSRPPLPPSRRRNGEPAAAPRRVRPRPSRPPPPGPPDPSERRQPP